MSGVGTLNGVLVGPLSGGECAEAGRVFVLELRLSVFCWKHISCVFYCAGSSCLELQLARLATVFRWLRCGAARGAAAGLWCVQYSVLVVDSVVRFWVVRQGYALAFVLLV